MEINIIPVAAAEMQSTVPWLEKEERPRVAERRKGMLSDAGLFETPRRRQAQGNARIAVDRLHAAQAFARSESTTFKTSSVQKLQSAQVVTTFVSNIEEIFAKFLKMEVGDGAASADTIRNYLSQTKQYLDWCRDNLLPSLEADAEDIKLYRQYLVQSGYQNSTIATKLNIVRIFYKAALTHGLIKSNPAQNIKAPKDRKDPAARITFMEAEELKFLLDHIQSQLERAKTNKQKLVLMRDRILIGIMGDGNDS